MRRGEAETYSIEVKDTLHELESAFTLYREGNLKNCEAALDRLLIHLVPVVEQIKELELIVAPQEIHLGDVQVYSSDKKHKSICRPFFESAIRMLTFKAGINRPELMTLLECMATNFDSPQSADQDLYCLMFIKRFPHIEVTSDDIIQKAYQPGKAREKLDEFLKVTKARTLEKTTSKPRKLRDDDLKTIEEFKLNPKIFLKSDEEIQKVVEASGILGQRLDDRQILERFIEMGNHFIESKTDRLQREMGRKLLIQSAFMALEGAQSDLFKQILERISKPAETAEGAEEEADVMELLFHIDQLGNFIRLLKRDESRAVLLPYLMKAPPSALRLCLLLLSELPELKASLEAFILQHMSSQVLWILDNIRSHPDQICWVYFIEVLSRHRSPFLRKFALVFLESADQNSKQRLFKMLSKVVSEDVVSIFADGLQSKEKKIRLEMFGYLSALPNAHTMKALRKKIESPEINDMEQDEQQALCSTLLAIAKEAAFSWIEALWINIPPNLVDRSGEINRRMAIINVLKLSAPQLLLRLQGKVPDQELHPDVKKAFEFAILEQKTEGKRG